MSKEIMIDVKTISQSHFEDDVKDIGFTVDDNGGVMITDEHREFRVSIDDLRAVIFASDLIRKRK